ncbi:MAG: hypothetical protein WDW38_001925 [Sanguina aurantia]
MDDDDLPFDTDPNKQATTTAEAAAKTKAAAPATVSRPPPGAFDFDDNLFGAVTTTGTPQFGAYVPPRTTPAGGSRYDTIRRLPSYDAGRGYAGGNTGFNGGGGGYIGSGSPTYTGGGYVDNWGSAAGSRTTNRGNLNNRNLKELDYFMEEAPPPPPAYTLSQENRFINGKELLCNRNITLNEVFLIGGKKEKMGLTGMESALNQALELKVDLVLVNPEAHPPVARLIKWDRYKFELEKDKKEKKAGASVVETKEVRLRPTTDTGDVVVKVKAVAKFLEKGNRVKITMKFEGRELQFKEQGKETLLRFIEGLGEAAKVDGPLNFKTGTYTVMLAPTGKAAPASILAAMQAAAPATTPLGQPQGVAPPRPSVSAALASS